jgi:hypothetical protein
MHKLLFIIAFLLAAYGVTRAQSFDYTVTTDSVAWNELNAQTILNTNNSAWNFSYRVPIGFTFNFLGRNFDSLTVETNGYIVFDENRNYAITAFSGVGDHVDSLGNHAVIGYELTGSTGNHILKLQYKNASPFISGNEIQSWQVWLRENGNVEVHIGPGTMRCNEIPIQGVSEFTEMDTLYYVTQLDSAQHFRIGLLNMNMDTEVRGYFIGANPSAPATHSIDDNTPEIPVLDFIPARGYRYTFTPSIN